ncbi:hypothetical protein L596_003047 [Steinernema carpocapsae]|uniref:Carboxylesterase type B domain-containing protein n=1 Tax=Steinernema carpocapsae TaxID=34508 RepID=A0A4V6I7W5_STECR|nr:hypothetical protein L596_003047 [Steinernema carpocapsae]
MRLLIWVWSLILFSRAEDGVAAMEVLENVVGYLGIPYAEPPLATKRFEDPRPLRDEQIIPSEKARPGCFQMIRGKLELTKDQSEDCLYLSLLLPRNINADKKLHVLVFFTNANPDLKELARRVTPDLGVAQVSFREGPFGFFKNEIHGIKDILLSLDVIKKKLLPRFGLAGDVTVIGEHDAASLLSFAADVEGSARSRRRAPTETDTGSFWPQVSLKLTSPSSTASWAEKIETKRTARKAKMNRKRMSNRVVARFVEVLAPFDRAVFLSGNKYVGRFNERKEVVERNADRLLRATECDLPSETQALDCLRTKSISEIRNAIGEMKFEEVHGAPFQPLIDGNVKNVFPAIVALNTELQKDYLSPEEFDTSYSYTDFKRFLAHIISEKDYSNAPLLRRLALYEYIHSMGDKHDTYFLFEQTRKMILDKHFYAPTFRYAIALNSPQNSVYLLEHPQQDILYKCFFTTPDDSTEAFCKRFLQYIYRFSTKGAPTDSACDLNNPNWPALKSIKRDYFLVLNEDGQVEWEFDFHLRAIAFWEDLVPAMAKIELTGKREALFEEVSDLTAYEEEDDVQLWHTMEQPDLTEEKALNDMPLHFDL